MSDLRFSPDFSPMGRPYAFIQWKGTDVCLDFYCDCGYQGHFDGYFAYRIRCVQCGKEWDTPHSVKVVPAQTTEAPTVEPI